MARGQSCGGQTRSDRHSNDLGRRGRSSECVGPGSRVRLGQQQQQGSMKQRLELLVWSGLAVVSLLASGQGASPKLRGAGYNGNGGLGTGRGIADSYLLQEVNLTLKDDGVIHVSMLDNHAILLNGDPAAAAGMAGWIWGSNAYGQLGLTSDVNTLPFLSLPTRLSPILFPSTATGNKLNGDVAYVYQWNASCSCESSTAIQFSGLMSFKDIQDRFNQFTFPNAISIVPDYAGDALYIQLRLTGSRIDVTNTSVLKDRLGLASTFPQQGLLNEISPRVGNRLRVAYLKPEILINNTCNQLAIIQWDSNSNSPVSKVLTISDGLYSASELATKLQSAAQSNGIGDLVKFETNNLGAINILLKKNGGIVITVNTLLQKLEFQSQIPSSASFQSSQSNAVPNQINSVVGNRFCLRDSSCITLDSGVYLLEATASSIIGKLGTNLTFYIDQEDVVWIRSPADLLFSSVGTIWDYLGFDNVDKTCDVGSDGYCYVKASSVECALALKAARVCNLRVSPAPVRGS
eukprot:764529-Hanusia_phi.AAC.7